MYDYTTSSISVVFSALDAACRAEFSDRISGISTDNVRLRIHFYEPYTTADETAAQAIIDAHDPVFITATRDDNDVTVTLSKPRNVDSATELTLMIDGEAAPSATALTNNVATVQVESADKITIGLVESYPHREVRI